MRKLFLVGMVVALVAALAGCKVVVTPTATERLVLPQRGDQRQRVLRERTGHSSGRSRQRAVDDRRHRP